MKNAIYALLASAAVTMIAAPILIPMLHKLKFGQSERELGPQTHLKKAGTPTMGGIAFLIGIIAATLNGNENNDKLLSLHADKFPLVLIERYGDELNGIPRFCFNNQEAMELSVEKLYQNGHRRIAYISGPKEAYNARLRLNGYKAALKKFGLPLDENLIRYGDYKLDFGKQAMRDLLCREDFTAFAAANDLIAIGACKAIREAGLSVPEDISAVGFDGTLLADLHQPRLDTVMLSGGEMGLQAAQCLLKQIRNEEVSSETICFHPQLRAGASIRNISNRRKMP